jgi:hypothetical protein
MAIQDLLAVVPPPAEPFQVDVYKEMTRLSE